MVWFRPITWCFTSRNPHQQSRSGLPAHPTSRPHPPNVESLVEAFARNEPLRPTSFGLIISVGWNMRTTSNTNKPTNNKFVFVRWEMSSFVGGSIWLNNST